MSAALPLLLLERMARREAAGLTLTPEIRVHTTDPGPDFVFRRTGCSWCGVETPRPPLHEVVDAGDPAAAADLPEVSVLRCEDISARSLLALSLVRVEDVATSPRLVSRAAYWAGVDRAEVATPERIVEALERMDARERWFDEVIRVLRSGASRWHGHLADEGAVLPASTRATRAGGHDGVAASRRGLHFLTPHATGPYADRLNAAYGPIRFAAVARALGLHSDRGAQASW